MPRQTIVYYVEREGGVFQDWPADKPAYIEDWRLDAKRKSAAKGQQWIWIEGVQCHAIFLADGRAWDIINGFRNTGDWRKIHRVYPNAPPDWRKCRMPEQEKEKASAYDEAFNSDLCLTCGRPALECQCKPGSMPVSTPVPTLQPGDVFIGCPKCLKVMCKESDSLWHCFNCGNVV